MFLNQQLVALASHPAALLVHPHAQRTGGGTLRNQVLAAGFGRARVYSRMFVTDWKPWATLTNEDLHGFRAYTDLFNYCDLPLARKCLPVALLRDPIHRAVSLYHFVRRKEAHDLHNLAMSTGLEEFYRAASGMNPRYFRNVQTSRICGKADARLALEYILTRYIAVGFTRDLNAFAETLSRLFNLSNVQVDQKASDRHAAQITPKFRETVLSQNEEDLALFEVMSRGPPYRLKTLSIRGDAARRAKRLRDKGLAAGRGIGKRIQRLTSKTS
ncbi:MAG: sulfotransferase family 2 domain-containing protein [Alphaproteobacteria bacterium]|nr:sulfotransferase family 2 domain-containing protein [Alphaproteobacteria bacterium]